jgi:hypothetical protein
VDGGRRIGKSVLGGREAFCQAVIPGSYIWIVGPTMDLAEKEFRIVWQKAVKEEYLEVDRKSERELFIKFTKVWISSFWRRQPDSSSEPGTSSSALLLLIVREKLFSPQPHVVSIGSGSSSSGARRMRSPTGRVGNSRLGSTPFFPRVRLLKLSGTQPPKLSPKSGKQNSSPTRASSSRSSRRNTTSGQ